MSFISLRGRLRRYGLLAAAGGLLAASCGACSDDSEEGFEPEERPPIPADWDPVPYCEAALGLETARAAEVDDSMGSEEAVAVVQDHANSELLPLVNDMAAAAPEAVRADMDDLVGAYEHLAETGDAAVLDDGGMPILRTTVHNFAVDQCGWSRVEVQATEYAFDGLPAELEPGTAGVLDEPVTSFTVWKAGEEAHEFALFRKADGVTAPVEELLALPEDEASSMLEMVGEPAVVEDGFATFTAVLEPGAYVAACFVPVGTTDIDDPGDGEPHVTHGMYGEFTVV